MSAVAVISNSATTALLFRKDLFLELQKHGHTVYLCAPDVTPELRSRLRAIGVTDIRFGISRSNRQPVRDVWQTILLSWRLRQIQPAFVICTFIKPVIFGTIAAWGAGVFRVYSFIEGLGFIFTETGVPPSRKRRLVQTLIAVLLRVILRYNKAVFVLNRDDEHKLVFEFRVPLRRIVPIDGIGVNLEEFAPTVPPTDPLRFLFIGRLLREKGVIEFFHAARMVREAGAMCEFWLVGSADDNPGAISEKFIREYEKHGIVKWLGYQNDMPSILRQTSVFVLPSWREGKPRSTMEAMAAGRAVITTDVPGCRETVQHGENGFLVPVRDEDAMARAMRTFVDNPDLVVQMGERSAAMAQRRFDVHTINQRIMCVINAEKNLCSTNGNF